MKIRNRICVFLGHHRMLERTCISDGFGFPVLRGRPRARATALAVGSGSSTEETAGKQSERDRVRDTRVSKTTSARAAVW